MLKSAVDKYEAWKGGRKLEWRLTNLDRAGKRPH